MQKKARFAEHEDSKEVFEYSGYAVGPSVRERVREIREILYRRRRLLISTFLLVLACAAVVSFTMAPVYHARALIMVDLGRTAVGQEPSELSVGSNLFATNERSLEGELFVIESSERIAAAVLARLEGKPQGTVRFEAAHASINAISVIGISSSPEEAALLANIYAEEYVSLTEEASRAHVSESRQFLEDQEHKRREELREAEDEVRRYIEEVGAVTLASDGAQLAAQFTSLQSQLESARVELQGRNTTLAALEDELKTLSPQIAERVASRLDLKIAAIQTKLGELEVAREEIFLHNPGKSREELKNTPLLQIEYQIDRLRTEIDALSKEYIDTIVATGGITSGEQGLSHIVDLKRKAVLEHIAILGLTSRINALEQSLGQQQSEINALPAQTIELARLERAKRQAEEAYSHIAQQLRMKRIEEETEPGYAHILQNAETPLEPVSPRHPRDLLLGFLVASLLGVGLALLRDKLDGRIYKPKDLQDAGYDVMGAIPDIEPIVKKEFGGAEYVERDGWTYSSRLVSHLLPVSGVAESYRHIRTRIQFSIPDRVIRTILVTSPSIGEGKSTSAANLAIVMAQARRRTLLIDADLRRPRLSTLFGVYGAPDLASLISEIRDFDLEKMQTRTSIQNLHLIGARHGMYAGARMDGTPDIDLNPSELLASPPMRELLGYLRSRFDIIIIDTPPLSAAIDATLLATQCDTTIVVAMAGKTMEDELEDAYDALDEIGVQRIGFLVNKFDVSLAAGKKYSYSYSKYGVYSQYKYYDQWRNGFENGREVERHSEAEDRLA